MNSKIKSYHEFCDELSLLVMSIPIVKLIVNIKVSTIIRYAVFISFFVAYTGHAFFLYPIYFLFLLKNVRHNFLTSSDIKVALIIGIFLTFKILNNDFGPAFTIFKYYFGFFIFYLFFRQHKGYTEIDINKLLLFISLITIVEAILINTVIPPEIMPNFPDLSNEDLAGAHKTRILGFITRPYSVGCNASITSSIIVCLMMLRLKLSSKIPPLFNVVEILSILAVFVSFAGTGYLLLFLYLMLRGLKIKRLVITALLLSVVYVAYFFLNSYENSSAYILYKISPDYVIALFEFKISQFANEYNIFAKGLFESLFGMGFVHGDPLPLMGDFGWLNFFYVNGVIGVLIYLILIISRLNTVNKWPLFLLVLGGFHYAAIFAMPAGQLLFAYCLALSPQPIEKSEKGGVVHVS